MNKRYRLGEIEEAVSEMEELIGLEDDIAEIDDDFQIVVSGWSVYVESLNLTLRQGIACVWDAEEGLFMPDFDVTIVYEGNIETGYSRSDASVVNESGESMQASFDRNSIPISLMPMQESKNRRKRRHRSRTEHKEPKVPLKCRSFP